MVDTDDTIGVRSVLDDNDSTELEYTQSDIVGGKKVHKRIVKTLDDVSALVTDGILVAAVLDTTPGASEPGLVVRLAGAAGTSTQYAEDTPHVDGDIVTLAGVVRQDADAALSGDGDRTIPQVDASGWLKVNVKAGSAGGTEYTEDAGLPADPAGGILIARRADTPAATVSTDGDAIALNSTDKGELYVKHLDSVAITAAALPLPAGAATEATLAAQSAKLPATLGQKAMAASLAVVIASDQSAVAVDGSAVTQPISAAALPLPSGAATSALQGGGLPAALVGGRLDTNVGAWLGATTPTVGQKAIAASLPVTMASDQPSIEVEGDAAHDAAVAGNPVRIGAKANADEPAEVNADNDTVDLWADRLGRLVVLPGHPNPETPVAVSASAADQELIAAPGASLSLYIVRVLVTNRAAAENVASLHAAGGSDVAIINCAADGGGAVIDFGSRGWKLAANTALQGDAGAASIDFNVLEYYIAA